MARTLTTNTHGAYLDNNSLQTRQTQLALQDHRKMRLPQNLSHALKTRATARVSLLVCLYFVCLSIFCLSFVCLSIYLSFYVSIYLSVRLSVILSICLYVYL